MSIGVFIVMNDIILYVNHAFLELVKASSEQDLLGGLTENVLNLKLTPEAVLQEQCQAINGENMKLEFSTFPVIYKKRIVLWFLSVS